MRVVHVLSNDCLGGLNQAALRLHEELLRQGTASWVCVQARCAHTIVEHSRPEFIVAHERCHAALRLVSLLVPAIHNTASHKNRRDAARRHACDAWDIRAVAAQHQQLYDQTAYGPETK